MLRTWGTLSRGTFSGAIIVADVTLIVATSCLTGVIYHLAVYGNPGNVAAFVHVGVLAASIFAISNALRGEYPCRTSSRSSRTRGTPFNCGM